MNIITVELGTKLGYEDYRGEFYNEDDELIADWNYDKRQGKYIATLYSEKSKNKRFYADAVGGLAYQIKNYLKNLNHE